MSRTIVGLLLSTLVFMACLVIAGLFVAKEQGPPGLGAFEYTTLSTDATASPVSMQGALVSTAMIVGAAGLALHRRRRGESARLNFLKTPTGKLRRLTLFVRRWTPQSHYTCSR